MKEIMHEEKIRLQADLIRREKLYNYNKALSIAKEADKIVNYMLEGSIMFTYITRSGERKRVRGTLTTYIRCFGKAYNKQKVRHFIPYYNIDSNRWCAFHISSLVL